MDTAARGGLFIVLLGIDGSGKTSLLSALSDNNLTTVSWRELRHHELPSVMAPDAPTDVKNRLPDLPRAMFIGGHIVAQYEHLVRPNITAGRNVLLDSYWYKVLAKERLVGRPPTRRSTNCGCCSRSPTRWSSSTSTPPGPPGPARTPRAHRTNTSTTRRGGGPVSSASRGACANAGRTTCAITPPPCTAWTASTASTPY
ncbi:hypothetical protein GTV15_14290 [Streptomyces sp. SID7803]|nr:hypothetical protein [Streptomyces sp. SID7803]